MTTPGDFHTDVPLGTKVGTRGAKKKKPEAVCKAASGHPAIQRGLANRAIVRAAQLHKSAGGGCASCTFYTGAGTCFAYKQIPQPYLTDGVTHTVRHAGTGGFTYRKVDPADVVTKALDAGVGPHLAAWFGELQRGTSVAKSALHPSERIVVGYFYPNARADGTLIVDTQGDVVTMDTLRKTIEGFMAGDRILGMDHLRTGTATDRPIPVGEVLESHLLTKHVRKSLGLPDDLPLGWVGAARVDDEAAWQSVVAKERLSFSIGGKAERITIASGPE